MQLLCELRQSADAAFLSHALRHRFRGDAAAAAAWLLDAGEPEVAAAERAWAAARSRDAHGDAPAPADADEALPEALPEALRAGILNRRAALAHSHVAAPAQPARAAARLPWCAHA